MSSPKVTYSYANGSANTIRPTSVTYPDNTGGTRVLTYDYGTAGGMNDKLSRVESLGFGGTSNLVQPSYLGLGTQVRTNYTQPQVRWDLATGSGSNPYAGLDRFGRVIDNKWSNSSTSATLDQIKYTYDRASNRTTRENTVAKAQTTPKYFDELYGYDGSNRLTQMQRGQLAGTTSITNLRFAQDWGLDSTGNWQQFNEDSDGSGTNDLVQARTANPVNEITDITNSVGTPWVQPGYDAAGNMTTIPQGNEPEEGFTGVYDAWNRLVKLSDEDGNVVAEYAYDGLTRRIRKTTAAETRHYLYNASWQILEERREEFEAWDLLTTSSSSSSSSSTSSSSSSSSDNPNYDYCQYVWGLRYIDGLVFRDRQSTSGVERLYALQDANWNVDALVDTSGAVVERFSYSAYGMPSFLNPDFTAKTGSDYGWDVLYAGYKWDQESGMYQVRYRYLLPLLGCWGSRDPIGYEDSANNLAEYCQNNPIVFMDVFGLQANKPAAKLCDTTVRGMDVSGEKIKELRAKVLANRQNAFKVYNIEVTGKCVDPGNEPDAKCEDCRLLIQFAVIPTVDYFKVYNVNMPGLPYMPVVLANGSLRINLDNMHHLQNGIFSTRFVRRPVNFELREFRRINYDCNNNVEVTYSIHRREILIDSKLEIIFKKFHYNPMETELNKPYKYGEDIPIPPPFNFPIA